MVIPVHKIALMVDEVAELFRQERECLLAAEAEPERKATHYLKLFQLQGEDKAILRKFAVAIKPYPDDDPDIEALNNRLEALIIDLEDNFQMQHPVDLGGIKIVPGEIRQVTDYESWELEKDGRVIYVGKRPGLA